MNEKEINIEFYERLLYTKDCIIDGLRKENEELREKIMSLEKEIDELEWREECEIMVGEEYE